MDDYNHYAFLEERDKDWVTIPPELTRTIPTVTESDIKAFPKEHRKALYRLWSIKYDGEVPFEDFYNAVRWRHDDSLYQDGDFAALAFSESKDVNPRTGKREIVPDPQKMHRRILMRRQGNTDWWSFFRNLLSAGAITIGAMIGTSYIGSKYPLPADPPEPSLEERTAQRVRNAATMLAGMQNGKLTTYDKDGYITYEGSPTEKLSKDLEWLATGARHIHALDALLEQHEKADAKLGKKEAYALAALTLHAQHYALTIKGLSELSELDIAFQPIATAKPYEPDIASTSFLAEMYRQAKPEELVAIRKSLNKPCELLRQFCAAYEPVRDKLAAGKVTSKELKPLLASIMNCTQGMNGDEMNRARESFDRIIARAHATRREPAPTPIGARTGASTTSPGNGTNGKPATAIGGND